MDLTGYAQKVIFCSEKTFSTYLLLHEITVHTDASNNGLHAGSDISEITKSGFVWFCRKASQLAMVNHSRWSYLRQCALLVLIHIKYSTNDCNPTFATVELSRYDI